MIERTAVKINFWGSFEGRMEAEIIKCRLVTYKSLVLALVVLLILSVQLLSCREWIAAAVTTPARDWFHQVQVNIERGEQEVLYNSSDESDRLVLTSASSRSRSDDHVDNTVFPAGDADVWQCIEHRASYGRSWSEYWVAMTANASDQAALCAAHHASKQPMAPGPPRIAFLFLVLDEVPLESLWRAFFKGHEGKYSLYVHPHHANHTYPKTSLFHGRKIPSKPLQRFTISEPAAVRRALAYALLDANVPNAWFTVQSETSIPVRPFPFVYNYLMGSSLSFVESFYPWDWWRSQWREDQAPQLRDEQVRKGEVWITVHRRHAGLIVGDSHLFTTFKLAWKPYAISCEIYIPTLMHVADPSGIANRSVMYVNWSIVDSDHPQLFNSTNVNATLIRTIQEQRENKDGMYTRTHYHGHENQLSCTYNGSPNASCWLFARKFASGAVDLKALLTVREALGY